jgi:hypothetical protein
MALSTGRYRSTKPKPNTQPRRQEDLAQADRCITAAKKQVRRQKEIIEGLAHAGGDTHLAESLLGAMEHSLRAFEQHRELVLKWLKDQERRSS